MLGDQIGEEAGKTTGMRVLPGEGGRFVKMEISFQASGTLLGMASNNMGTYTAYERVPGQMYGEGHGIVMTADGQSAIWHAFGIGSPTGEGMGIRWRVALNFQAGEGSLSRLNGIVGVADYEVDNDGNSKATIHEWK